MDTENTTTPDYGHAPVAAAEAELHDFGSPEPAQQPADEHKVFTDHDFGAAT
jgi:hypothetical protein